MLVGRAGIEHNVTKGVGCPTSDPANGWYHSTDTESAALHTVMATFPRVCPSPTWPMASAVSLSENVRSMTGVILAVSTIQHQVAGPGRR